MIDSILRVLALCGRGLGYVLVALCIAYVYAILAIVLIVLSPLAAVAWWTLPRETRKLLRGKEMDDV